MATPATFDTLIGHVRRKCHYPEYTALPDSSVASILLGHIDDLVTELNLAGQLWFCRQTVISVQLGDDWVPVNADDLGRPIGMETYDPSNPNLDVRQVDIVPEPELVRYFGGGDPGPAGVIHSAEACSFGEDPLSPGMRAVRFGPKPAESAQYLLLYEPWTVRPQQFSDIGVPLPQIENHLANLAAYEALPYCRWPEDKTQNIGNMLMTWIQRGDVRFNRIRRQPKQENNFRIIPFGRNRWQGQGNRRPTSR